MPETEKRFRGERVKQILEDVHMTVQSLATSAGVSQGALSNWLNGVRNPKRVNIKAIASVLKCKVSDISDYSDEEFCSDELNFDFQQTPDRSHFFSTVFNELKKQVQVDGQMKVAEKLGVSQSHVGDLYNGKASIENLKLSAFLNLYPNAKITLRSMTTDDPIEGIQAIAECMNQEEAEKTFAILKIAFPEYANKIIKKTHQTER